MTFRFNIAVLIQLGRHMEDGFADSYAGGKRTHQ